MEDVPVRELLEKICNKTVILVVMFPFGNFGMITLSCTVNSESVSCKVSLLYQLCFSVFLDCVFVSRGVAF